MATGGVWWPVDSEDGDIVEVLITTERTDEDEVAIESRARYAGGFHRMNLWLSREQAAALVGSLVAALAESWEK